MRNMADATPMAAGRPPKWDSVVQAGVDFGLSFVVSLLFYFGVAALGQPRGVAIEAGAASGGFIAVFVFTRRFVTIGERDTSVVVRRTSGLQRWMPAALGLAGSALATLVLGAYCAGWVADLGWVGLPVLCGAMSQLTAGTWEFKTGNTFGAIAFSTYGALWAALGIFLVLVLGDKVPTKDVKNDLGTFLLAFAIFNTYMLFWSTRLNIVTFVFVLTLQVTEIVLFVGFFSNSTWVIGLGGYIGVASALFAWYAAAGIVVNAVGARAVLPLGRPLWVLRRS
jgi:succinate-acetate transporter protein